MSDLPPDDLEIVEVLIDPAMVRDALRFIHQMRNLEVLINSGKRTLLISDTSQNAVLDLRETPEEPEIEEEEA